MNVSWNLRRRMAWIDDGKTVATNMKQARQRLSPPQKRAAPSSHRQYETTYIPETGRLYSMVHDGHQIGDIRRIVVHDVIAGRRKSAARPISRVAD